MGGDAALLAYRRNSHKKPESKRHVCSSRSRWGNSVEMYPKETGSESMDWMNMTQESDMWPADIP